MREKIFGSRHSQVLFVLALLASILCIRLFVITILENEKWSDASENISTRSIYTTAPRGEIYDRYGRLLAGNKQNFSLRLSSSGETDEELNNKIWKIIEVLDKNGDELVDDFPITISNGKYEFTYDKEIKDWLVQNEFNEGLTAEEAFNAMRTKLGIDSSLDRYVAQEEMQTKYGVYPPISVVEMKYTQEIEKADFLSTYFNLEKDEEKLKQGAEEIFKEIRTSLKIDKSRTAEEARKIMVVRNELKELGYNQYIPAVISKNISNHTVMLMEEEGEDFKGVEVVSDSTRYYPNGNTASHILGYLGKITEKEINDNKDVGYDNNAIVGKEGIEGKYESVLRGINGEKKVQVDAKGQLQGVISQTEPAKGEDVYLTIDLELQEHAEQALAKTIKAMNVGGAINTEYGRTPTVKTASKAKTGAVVAIDVKSGDVLAMASYPDYDPNIFSEGISEENWESLQSTNIRDPLAPAPLYNLATMSNVQPGSTFKPITALAALESGLDPYRQYYDNGNIEMGNDFSCVAWTLGRSNHGLIDMFRAIEVSCNYYFFDIATGKDWYTGNSLGYKKDITVDDITGMAKQFGLGQPTGIEIDEAVVPVPTEKSKVDGLKTSLSYELYAGAEDYFIANVAKNPEKLDKSIEAIKRMLDQENVTWESINAKFEEVGVKEEKREKLGEKVLYDYLPQAKWSVGDAFNISIGQGANQYTTLQMANYAATLGNKGTLNQVSVIKAVEGESDKKEKKSKKVNISDEKYYEYVLEGMERVATGNESGVSSILGNLDFTVAAKTGTAQKEGKINPKSEVEYVKENLSKIAPSISWSSIEKEMKRLMEEYPETYTTKDFAVRRALINLSGGKVTTDKIDAYKSDYEEFAWVIAVAPADDPEIAVCAMVPQGNTAANAAPIVKEVLSKYFDKETSYTDFSIVNVIQ